MSQQTSTQRVKEIVKLHNEVEKLLRTSLEKAIKIGELLTQQKEEVGHGNWGDWLKDNVPFTWASANNYMKVYKQRDQLKLQTICNLTEAYNALNRPEKQPKAEDKKEPKAADEPENNAEYLLVCPKELLPEFGELIDELQHDVFQTESEFDAVWKALQFAKNHRELVNGSDSSATDGSERELALTAVE